MTRPPAAIVSVKTCAPCGRRDALHVGGRCAMADSHELGTCRGCGRPIAAGQKWCSEACFRSEDSPHRREDDR